MWSKIGYGILFAWVKLHGMLPFWALYILSDILYVVVYYIARYRLKVVRQNMRASFPDKSDDELRRMERQFYHHFCDYVVETFKLSHISDEEIKRRAHVINPEIFNGLTAGEHACIIAYMGHYGNWEWFTSADMLFIPKLYNIYRPLTNKAFDRMFIYLRTRFGAKCIRKNDTVRALMTLKRNHERSVIVFLSDQTPSKANIHYWTSFLNQDTPFYTGAERIARKLDLPVVFLHVRKVKRGYYTLEIELIAKSAGQTPEFWLTERYARMMEESILSNPAYWLWTHKRWKHKRETT